MTATRALIDRLKRRASDMAKPFIDAAQQPNATEMERAFGEAAQLILRDAETRAQLLPREEFEQRVEAFKDWHRRHEAAMRAEISSFSERGFRNNPKGPAAEARRRATAELDHRRLDSRDRGSSDPRPPFGLHLLAGKPRPPLMLTRKLCPLLSGDAKLAFCSDGDYL